MPRTYPSTVLPNVQVDPVNVVSTHPNAALNGLAAINTHAMVEALLLNVFSGLLGRKKAYGFGSIGEKEKSFRHVAKVSVDPSDLSRIEWSLDAVAQSRQGRDVLVNSLWATDDKFPDYIVLMDQESLNDTSESIVAAVEAVKIDEGDAIEIQDTMRSGLSLWDENDMGKARSDAVRAMTAIISSNILLTSSDEMKRSEARQVIDDIMSMCE